MHINQLQLAGHLPPSKILVMIEIPIRGVRTFTGQGANQKNRDVGKNRRDIPRLERALDLHDGQFRQRRRPWSTTFEQDFQQGETQSHRDSFAEGVELIGNHVECLTGDCACDPHGAGAAPLTRTVGIASAVARKAINVITYELYSFGERISVGLRFALLKNLVKRGASWPRALPELTVMQIYNALESRYIPPVLANVPVLLVRASAGEGADTPYRDLYRDQDFGWGQVAGQLELVDVRGGHSSMLQEEAIESLATAMLERFPVLL